MKNDSNSSIIDSLNIDYLSLYKCKSHTNLDKIIKYVKEMRKKYKKQNG